MEKDELHGKRLGDEVDLQISAMDCGIGRYFTSMTEGRNPEDVIKSVCHGCGYALLTPKGNHHLLINYSQGADNLVHYGICIHGVDKPIQVVPAIIDEITLKARREVENATLFRLPMSECPRGVNRK